jgi:hypothetical protein
LKLFALLRCVVCRFVCGVDVTDKEEDFRKITFWNMNPSTAIETMAAQGEDRLPPHAEP